MSAPPSGPGVLFFDGNCGMCTRARDLLERMNRTGDVRLEPLQAPDCAQRLSAALGRPLDDEELMASIWWLGDDGAVVSAAQAAAVASSVATGVSIPRMLYRVPGLGPLSEVGYRWVATHRQYFPGTTPHCQRTPSAC
ncbi:thiol-disulfide oxidoreductase DCC family protein [Williamsia herbipolensis]|uniref:thiol-disulfide oxidoreductase DCC family protein n=1 Tax=Williamsia herbipolensis TaxID=1603258 RepID=UPI000B237AF3|nr:DCC1-like thiol-disulfide oxidoreductase family protein [Williamsia herbipolensis]